MAEPPFDDPTLADRLHAAAATRGVPPLSVIRRTARHRRQRQWALGGFAVAAALGVGVAAVAPALDGKPDAVRVLDEQPPAEEATAPLLPADSAEPASPQAVLPTAADLGPEWRAVPGSGPTLAEVCRPAADGVPGPDDAARLTLTDGRTVIDVSAWRSSDDEARAVAEVLRGGGYRPSPLGCALTHRVTDISPGPTTRAPQDRGTDVATRVEHVRPDGFVVRTELVVAVQRGPLLAMAVARADGGLFTPTGASDPQSVGFQVRELLLDRACGEPGRPGCEGPADLGAGLLSPATLGPAWDVGRPDPADLPEQDPSLFCNGPGSGFGFSPPTQLSDRAFTGPGGATAWQALLAPLGEQDADGLHDAARGQGGGTLRGCSEQATRTSEVLVDENGEGSWRHAVRLTERLSSGESASALLMGVRRGPVGGLLTVYERGTAVDAQSLLADLTTGVCAVPSAAGC